MPAGRPTKYTKELGELCAQLVECTPGPIIPAFNARDDLPHAVTVWRWEQRDQEFRNRMDLAREIRAHLMVDEAIAIADESEHDTIVKTNRQGDEFESPNSEWMNRSRLRVDIRKWHASKMNQRVYGDHSKIDLGGQVGNPVQTESRVTLDSLTEEQRTQAAELARAALQEGK